ncbi:hypothetical protein [Dyadobacter alkalitolerans]|uniref:hypothetical protein n=1 Tax=Dyadobacter alkalitolerans TaxID=492736 RepID=UPI0012FBD3E6|nr:hypothetical protein [Dyadobacter alkalitolerans]
MPNYKSWTVLLMFCLSVKCLFVSGQVSNFSKGFKVGFGEGNCYKKGAGCLPSLPPLTPFPKLGESNTNYQDGYNRGFQIGLDLQRLKSLENSTYTPSPDSYRNVPQYTPSEYTPPYNLQLLNNVVVRKQRLFDSRVQWVQERIHKIEDLASILLQQYSPWEYAEITKEFTNYINTELNGKPLDYTDNSKFNNIVNKMILTETDIYKAYTYATSELNSVTIPSNFSTDRSNTNCTYKAMKSKIVSYSLSNISGKRLTENDYVTFDILKNDMDDENYMRYYLYSKTDNSYFYTNDSDVQKASQENSTAKMKYLGFSSPVFFMLIHSNTNDYYKIFDKGISKERVLNNLGAKALKTSLGDIGVYIVYQDKHTGTKYYVPNSMFISPVINQEYPIYSK